MHLPILRVFASLREIRFLFLGFGKEKRRRFLTGFTGFTGLTGERGGELDEGLGTLKRRFQHLPILCVFASLREIRFRFLGFGKEKRRFF